MKIFLFARCTLAAALISLVIPQGFSAPITWIGGNADWNATNANWNPADEPDANDEAIFTTPNVVDMANATDTILGLTLSGGIDLSMNGNDLVVDGLVQLVDADTNLFIGSATSLLTADTVTINAGATLRMTGGAVTIVEETGNGGVIVNTDGILSGNGAINLNDAVAAGTVLLTLSGGTLTATSTVPGDLFGTVAATLTINISDVDARIDLDNISAITNVGRNDTLQINGLTHGAADPYSGTLNLAEGSTFGMSAAWQTDSATINANTANVSNNAGTSATLTGAAFTFAGGSINLDAIDSLRFSAPFTTTAGTINNAGHIIFNAATTIGSGTDFQMTGSSASLTVNAGITVNIDDADFNPDGGGVSTNIITIHSGGVLDLDLGAAADESLSGGTNLNGGELNVTTIDDNWSINGPVNVGASTGTSQINGEEVTFTGSTVTVGAGSTLDVNANSIWTAGENLIISAGAVVSLDGVVTFAASIGNVDLNGGELRGSAVTNVGAPGISGFGLISAPIVNTTHIDAENGALLVQTVANNNDWDGATGDGQLRAILGDLEIRDNAGFLFTGDVVASQDHVVFVNGFELEFEPGSSLSLGSGTYRGNITTDFGGTMTVVLPVTGESALRVAGTFTFQNGSVTTLNGNLELNNTLTIVQVGADFSGGGALTNRAGRSLRLLDGVVSSDLAVLIANEGSLLLGLIGADAQVQATDYQQEATGILEIEIGGTALNAFDRLNLTGAAALAGTLDLDLIGGFVPAQGQTFNILTATNGISGAFTSVTQPSGMPAGLGFSVSYSGFIVTLTVTTSYEAFINSFGLTNAADRLKTADPDNDGLNNQGEFALDGNAASGADTGKVVAKIAPVAGINALTLTFPVRSGTTPDPADPPGGQLALKQFSDVVSYTIQASDIVANWILDVTEVTGVDATNIQAGLPALSPGWVYRTFRSPGPVAGDPAEFMRIVIGE